MKLIASVFLLAMTPSTAHAAPTYLTCTFMVDGRPDILKIAADPDKGTVTTLVAFSGVVRQRAASFGPSEVIFGDSGVNYNLNRVTLRLAKTINIINSTTYAQCRKAAQPKTAF